MARAVAAQPEAEAGVERRGFGVHRGKVLGEENVLESVAVEVRRGDPERGSELGVTREFNRLESVAGVEEGHRAELDRGDPAGEGCPVPEDLGESGLAVGRVGCESLEEKRERTGEHGHLAARGEGAVHEFGFDDVDHARLCKLAVGEGQGLLRRGAVGAVESPV